MAIDLNNLATLLLDSKRTEEAEPLLRRALEILAAFSVQTGHEHPEFQLAKRNYEALQRTMGPE